MRCSFFLCVSVATFWINKRKYVTLSMVSGSKLDLGTWYFGGS